MKKVYILILLVFIFNIALPANAAIDPIWKECLQRGYKSEYKNCVFPDGSKCLVGEFNAGTCGAEFMTDYECIKEGSPVWDRDKCCEGLTPYSNPRAIGHPNCMEISLSDWLEYQLYRWGITFSIVVIFIFIFILIIVIIYSIIHLIKKKRNK